MDNEKETKDLIFLHDWMIHQWERPLKEGYFRTGLTYDGKTELKKFLGQEIFNDFVGNYFVNAFAAMYLADISRSSGSLQILEEDPELINPLQEEVLYVGGIQIYNKGIVPGTKINGLDFLNSGKIWFAEKFLGNGKNSLKKLILGDLNLKKDSIKRIEKIIQGYEFQEKEEKNAQFRREHENFRSGYNQSQEAAFGTFGRGARYI